MSDDVVTVDVRQTIQSGQDPFSLIMRAVSQLSERDSLLLLAPFEPEPLYEVMALRGFDYTATPRANGDWEILFSPGGKRAAGPAQRRDRSRGTVR